MPAALRADGGAFHLYADGIIIYLKESIRSRVAMDFTGPYGRIVEDPQEAKAIAVAEGYFWKRRRKPSGRQTPCANQVMTWPFK